MTYSLTSRVPDAGIPTSRQQSSPPPGVWDALEHAFDRDAVRALPDADRGCRTPPTQGGEFLEVSDGETRTRVDFPKGAGVPEVAPLLDALRDLRARLAAEHRR